MNLMGLWRMTLSGEPSETPSILPAVSPFNDRPARLKLVKTYPGSNMKRLLVVAAIVASSMTFPANARPVGCAVTTDLVRDAELIFVGRAIDSKSLLLNLKKNTGAGLDGWQHSTLSVERLLKGKPATEPVKMDIPLYMSGPAGISKGLYGIFFLKFDKKRNAYLPVEQDHPVLPAVRGHNVPDGSDVTGTVSNLLTDVLATPATQLASGVNGRSTWWDGQVTTTTNAQSLYFAAVEGLHTIPGKYSNAALTKIATTAPKINRIIAINCLVRNGDWKQLPSIQSDLVHPSPDLVDSVRSLASMMESGVASMIHDEEGEWVQNITGGVPLLTALMRSTDTEVRASATAILREIGGQEVISPLGKIGLYDKYQRVRWKAMAGLAEATGLRKQYPLFNDREGTAVTKAESKYLNFWRDWIAKNGNRKTIPPKKESD